MFRNDRKDGNERVEYHVEFVSQWIMNIGQKRQILRRRCRIENRWAEYIRIIAYHKLLLRFFFFCLN